MDKKRYIGFWILIILGTLHALLILVVQTLSLINYDLIVSLGLQESAEEITAVGILLNKGFAFGDLIWYMPILILGIVGLIMKKTWGLFSMLGALSITVYWPVVTLYIIYDGKNVLNLDPGKYITFSVILPLFTIYGLWGIWYLYKNQKRLVG